MKRDDVILVRGGGDLATGSIHRLWSAGLKVLVLEAEHPAAIRRQVSVSEAVYEGGAVVEGMRAALVKTLDEAVVVWRRGYVVQHTTHVMTMDLANFAKKDPAVAVTVSSFIPPKWIDSLFALKSTTNVMHRMVVPSMYRAIPKETICTSIQDETGTIVATGLGIRDRDYVGVYAIHVHPAYRHRHYASSICRTILSEGIRLGATKAYLQVVEGNTPAITLYESLGFSYLYTYWFRAKNVV